MEKDERATLNRVDRKIKTVLKQLNEEYEISESPAIAKAIQDLYEIKDNINDMI